MARETPLDTLSQHRHHGPHRCREDDDDRAHPLLHRKVPQNRRGARRHRDDGLDGAGAGARHHDHVCRDHCVLDAQRHRVPHQHHRHAGPRRLHRRSGALASRARRRGHAARLRRRRRAADRDGVAPGRPVHGPAPHLLEQDGPHRRRLRSLPGDDPRPPHEGRVSAPAAGRLGRALHGPHRRHRAQAVHLRRRDAGQEVRGCRRAGQLSRKRSRRRVTK